MDSSRARLPILSTILAMTAVFLVSCSAGMQSGGMNNESIEGIYLSADGSTAKVVFSGPAYPSGACLHAGTISVFHYDTGIKLTYRLFDGKKGCTFSNHGLLLKKGERVAIISEGFSPAWAVIE